MDDTNYKIPLGLCKQAVMKLDSFINDINEIREDADIDPEDKETFDQISEIAGTMIAAITNIVSKEINEDDFLNETIDMDEIDPYPGDDTDILDQSVE